MSGKAKPKKGKPTQIRCVLKRPFYVPMNAVKVECQYSKSCEEEVWATPDAIDRFYVCCDECMMADNYDPESFAPARANAVLSELGGALSGNRSKIPMPSWRDIVRQYNLTTLHLDPDHRTALHYGFLYECDDKTEGPALGLTKALIEEKADVNARVSFCCECVFRVFFFVCFRVTPSACVQEARFETPLHGAALRGHARAIKLLCDAKADVHAKSNHGVFVLLCGVLVSSDSICVFDLVVGATPLHNATNHCAPLVVPALIAAGARFKKNVRRSTPLHYVFLPSRQSKRGDKSFSELTISDAQAVDICKVLLTVPGAHKYIDTSNEPDDQTALSMCVEVGFIKTAAFLLEQKANVNVSMPARSGFNVLALAVKQGRVDFAKLFVQAGACTHPHWVPQAWVIGGRSGLACVKLTAQIGSESRAPRELLKLVKTVMTEQLVNHCDKCDIDGSEEGLSVIKEGYDKRERDGPECSNPACPKARSVWLWRKSIHD